MNKAEQYYQCYKNDPTMQEEVQPAQLSSLFTFADNKDKILMGIGTIFALASGASLVFYSQPFGQLVDALDPNQQPNAIVDATLSAVYLFLINSVVVFISSWFMSAAWMITSQRQMNVARRQYFKSLLKQQTSWHDRNKPAQVCSKMYIQISKVHYALVNNVTSILTKVSISLSGIIIALSRGWKMSFVMLAFLPIMILVGFLCSYFYKKIQNYSQKYKTKIDSQVIQIFDNVKTIKLLDGQEYQSKRYQNKIQFIKNKSAKNTIKHKLAFGLFFFFILINYTVGFSFGAKLVSESTINQNSSQPYSVSDVVVIFITLYLSNLSFSGLPQSITSFGISRISMTKILNIVNRQPKITDGTLQFPSNLKLIKFNNVLFQYEKPLFKNFNFSITKGITAFIGESGSGKTTIINLLNRFYDVFEGQIQYIGTQSTVNLKDVKFKSLRNKIGYVGQEPVLIGKTIREVLGAQEIPNKEIFQILQACQAKNFIDQIGIDNEYNNLSGGQKQRIAIARALIKKPQILILDQGTSALDRKNQQQILKALKHRQIPFIIMIAHRMQTVVNADTVVLLQKGQIIQSGTYKQMCQANYIKNAEISEQLIADNPQRNLVIKQQEKKKQIFNMIERQESQSTTVVTQQQQDKQFQCRYIFELIKYNQQYWPLYVVGFIAAAYVGSVFPAFAFILSKIIVTLTGVRHNTTNELQIARFQLQVQGLSLSLLIISLVSLLLISIKGIIFTFLTENLGSHLKISAFSILISKPMSTIQQEGAQKSATIINTNCEELKHLGGNHLSDSVENIVTIIIGLLIAFIFSWQITLVSLGVFPLIIISGKIQMSFSQGMSSNTDKEHKKTHQIVIQSIMHHKTVLSLHAEEKIIHKFTQSMSQALIMSVKYGNFTGIMFGLGQSLISILLSLIFYIGSLLIRAQLVSVLQLYTAIYAVMFAGVQAGGNLLFLSKLSAAKVAACNYFQIIQQQNTQIITGSTIENKNNKMKSSKCQNQQGIDLLGLLHSNNQLGINLHHVCFKYPQRQEYLFQDLNLKIEESTKVALVGQSGSGKSTIANLLFRLYEPVKGQIYYNNKNIKDINRSKLRTMFGIVSQEPVLFNRSVFENIQYNSGASYSQVIQASKVANAYEFICQGNFGLQDCQDEQDEILDKMKNNNEKQFKCFRKSVGPRGSYLSGGQKQRIAIARALIRKPAVMVLDEATSALDNNNEQIIQSAIQSINNVTQIIIAHRLSTVEKCHKVVVMKHGKIVESGTYQELINKRQHFYNLINAGK